MRKVLLIILLVTFCAEAQDSYLLHRRKAFRPAAAGGGGGFSDNFNRANGGGEPSLGANWAETAGDCDIVNSDTRFGVITLATDVTAIYTGQATSTINQYAKITLSNCGAGTYPWFHFNADADGAPYGYVVAFQINENVIAISSAEDGALGSAATTVDSGQTWGVTRTGTGASTRFRCWLNPTGNAPDSATSWGGDTTPEVDITINPATPHQTFKNVGLGGYTGGSALQKDDFFAGDIP